MNERIPTDGKDLPEDRYWILILTTLICMLIVFSAMFFYPLNTLPWPNIVLFEILANLGIMGIMKLIYDRGLPEEVIQSRE